MVCLEFRRCSVALSVLSATFDDVEEGAKAQAAQQSRHQGRHRGEGATGMKIGGNAHASATPVLIVD